MSNLRLPMVWSGGLLASAGLVLIVLRLIGAHEAIPSIGALPILHYYGAAIGCGFVGILFLLTAPSARRSRARVRLDERPVQEMTTLRPKYEASPHTTGFAAPKPQAPEPPAPQTATAEAAPRAQGQTVQTEMGAPAEPNPTKETWGSPRDAPAPTPQPRQHPNEPHGAPDPAPSAPRVPDESEARLEARRHQLAERLEELEQKANQAKVRYGLGKVSAAGYRQYLAEVDRERMMIETELMEGEE